MSPDPKGLRILLIAAMGTVFWGCAPAVVKPVPRPSRDLPAQPGIPVAPPAAPEPRNTAALYFTRQGEQLLASRKPDEAIRILERAITLNPADGLNYYYLAEAWYMKADYSQALEFNRLAFLYLQTDDRWAVPLMAQRTKIEQLQD